MLVFHSVNGIGWEPRTAEELEEYFGYIDQRKDQLLVATFADVTKYIIERKNAIVRSAVEEDAILVTIDNDLDPSVYDVPVTLKTYVPSTWLSAKLFKGSQQESKLGLEIRKDPIGSFVMYSVMPEEHEITLTE